MAAAHPPIGAGTPQAKSFGMVPHECGPDAPKEAVVRPPSAPYEAPFDRR